MKMRRESDRFGEKPAPHSKESLAGVGRDTYGRALNHNLRLYVRPAYQKVLAFSWDMDNKSFGLPTDADLFPGANLRKVIDIPSNTRLFYGHLLDLMNTTFNRTYMTYWAGHYSDLLPGQDFTSVLSYIDDRSAFATSQLPAEIPFAITSADPLDVGAASVATIEGQGWINVREIRLAGNDRPLDVSWNSLSSWQTVIPVDVSTDTVTLEAYDYQGMLINTDSIVVNSTALRPIIDQLRVTEIMYNPPGGGGDPAEFIELMNVSDEPIPSLQGVTFTAGIAFTFPDIPLAAGERVVVVRNAAGFEAAFGTEVNVAGAYTGTALANEGERILLVDSDGAQIQDFIYDDTGEGWHPTTDGDGFSLVIIDPAGDLANWSIGAGWRPRIGLGGSPGSPDILPGDVNVDGRVGLLDLAIIQENLGAIDATPMQGDLTDDGLVNRADMVALLRHFGRSVIPVAPAPAALSTAADLLAEESAIAAVSFKSTSQEPAEFVEASTRSRAWAQRRPVEAAVDHFLAQLSEHRPGRRSLTALRAGRHIARSITADVADRFFTDSTARTPQALPDPTLPGQGGAWHVL